MALQIIVDECTSCDACLPVCPSNAISVQKMTYVIDPDLCTECEGSFDTPQCVEECPIDGCIVPV